MLRALAGAGAALPLVVPWLLTAPDATGARLLERRFHRRIAAGFGIAIEAEGDIACGGTLFVANHVSWADILVMGAIIDAQFVAKNEVAGWPLLGALARRRGTIFVDRTRPRDAGGQADALRSALDRGDDVLLFPEGTTSDGTTVAPFRTSLFVAAEAAVRVQPVAISFADRGGRGMTDGEMRAFAWAGEQPLGANARRLAATGAHATARFLPPIDTAGFDRKRLAAEAHRAIANAYHAARGRTE